MANRRGGTRTLLPVVVGCLALSALSTGARATAAQPEAARVDIVLDQPSPGRVYEDTWMELTGRLSKPRSGKEVVIQRLTDAGWRPVATTKTDESGEFRARYAPVDPGEESLRALHRAQHHVLVSGIQPLEVLDRRVFLAATRSSYQALGGITVSGVVRPRGEGRRIWIQRLVAGRWQNVRGGFTNASGGYRFAMPDNEPGGWSIRAFWPGGRPSEGTAEYSPVRRYQVRAVLDPVVTRVTRQQLGGSFHEGCPVGPALLRNVSLTYRAFSPVVRRGTLVVRSTIVDDVVDTFGQALASGYPIRRMLPTAHYGGSDVQSMRHDNTSAFNCRHVTGDPTRLSPHSYGIAIDIDTVENPYLDIHGRWWPRGKGAEFRDRSRARPGMLYAGSRVTQALSSRGFQWGGRWSHPDYQHFDTWSAKRQKAPPSGPLTSASLPAPRWLGADWTRYGAAAASGAGRGTDFGQPRVGREAGQGALPLGCRAPIDRSLPVPRFALQGSYLSTRHGVAQAVVMKFGSQRMAESYFGGLVSALRACTTADGPSGVTVRPIAWGDSQYRGEREYAAGERWREHDVLVGSRVTVVLAPAGPSVDG